MPKNPLIEVFGYPVENMSPEAIRHRKGRLCPFHNSSGLNCTKNSATDPLGVCTVLDRSTVAITCPIRFRQDQLIVSDAASFFFPTDTPFVTLTEVRLNDRHGKSAGNIDIALVALDENHQIIDFGALEVQAVYISGNVSKAFKEYMKDPSANHDMDWPSKGYPKPDYLSSSRKRLAPQLIYKGGILNSWGKKIVVAVQRPFFEQLPILPQVKPSEADIAWMIYDLNPDEVLQRFKLERTETYYTKFKASLDIITNPEPGNVADFITYLKGRVKNGKMMGMPPQSDLPPSVEPSPLAADEDMEALS